MLMSVPFSDFMWWHNSLSSGSALYVNTNCLLLTNQTKTYLFRVTLSNEKCVFFFNSISMPVDRFKRYTNQQLFHLDFIQNYIASNLKIKCCSKFYANFLYYLTTLVVCQGWLLMFTVCILSNAALTGI